MLLNRLKIIFIILLVLFTVEITTISILIATICIDFDKTFGGKYDDNAYSIAQTKDGGYIVAGKTSSKNIDSDNAWVIKLNKKGEKLWDKAFGGKNVWANANSIIQTKDGGYIVAGKKNSKGIGNDKAWVIRLNKQGEKLWDKTFGSKNIWANANSIIQIKDGGYIVVGRINDDAWIIKINKNGKKLWDKKFGAKNVWIKNVWANAKSIIQTKDDGYIIAGGTSLKDIGKSNAWIIKLNNKGEKLWDKIFGGRNWDEANSIIQTKDGGYIVAGKTSSKGAGSYDAWVIRLNKDGNMLWDKTFGGKDLDEAKSIIQTKDEGYILTGKTSSKGAGSYDAWVIRLNKDGKKIWDRTFGSKDWDEANSIIQTKDGNYIIAGIKSSKGAGSYDAWVMKIKSNPLCK